VGIACDGVGPHMSHTCSPSLEKLADRMEGLTMTSSLLKRSTLLVANTFTAVLAERLAVLAPARRAQVRVEVRADMLPTTPRSSEAEQGGLLWWATASMQAYPWGGVQEIGTMPAWNCIPSKEGPLLASCWAV
jgi:hypothetical protein